MNEIKKTYDDVEMVRNGCGSEKAYISSSSSNLDPKEVPDFKLKIKGSVRDITKLLPSDLEGDQFSRDCINTFDTTFGRENYTLASYCNFGKRDLKESLYLNLNGIDALFEIPQIRYDLTRVRCYIKDEDSYLNEDGSKSYNAICNSFNTGRTCCSSLQSIYVDDAKEIAFNDIYYMKVFIDNVDDFAKKLKSSLYECSDVA